MSSDMGSVPGLKKVVHNTRTP